MKLETFKPEEMKPRGWLKRQLEIQAKGLSGNLYKIWPDIRDSVRIGGTRNDWERVPYWLDGFIPLAYLLDDEEKKQVVETYICAIVKAQQKDGWIVAGPKAREEFNDNTWEYLLTLKVLALYCGFTGSRKVERVLYRATRSLYESMKSGEVRLVSWGKYRWFEGLIAIRNLYRKKKEDWLLELARMLKEQGIDWTSLKETWIDPINEWTMDTHIVNIAMMFKYEALCSELLGESYGHRAEELWQSLERHHGTVTGAFTGDECLGGLAANRGFELCSVVELMYSCEVIYSITGDKVWAERLERLAFNALPATISDDMWTHQYDQMTNQIACYRQSGKPIYGTNFADANMFGLEPNFGCCTSNFSQGWPKLAMHVFLKCHGGILAAQLLPSTLQTKIKGNAVTVQSETDYPFKHKCKFVITVEKPTKFAFKVRIPSWAKDVKLNGQLVERKPYLVINQEFNGSQEFVVEFSDVPHLMKRPYNLQALQYGALVYALPIQMRKEMHEYEADGVERKYPYCDYEYFPESAWNYGFASKEFRVCEYAVSEIPFSSEKPAVTIETELAQVDWPLAEGYTLVCDRKPRSNRAVAKPERMELIPYGCAKLRMTEMPLVSKGGLYAKTNKKIIS